MSAAPRAVVITRDRPLVTWSGTVSGWRGTVVAPRRRHRRRRAGGGVGSMPAMARNSAVSPSGPGPTAIRSPEVADSSTTDPAGQHRQPHPGRRGQHTLAARRPVRRPQVGHHVDPVRSRVLEVAHHEVTGAGQRRPVEEPEPIPGHVGADAREVTQAGTLGGRDHRRGLAVLRALDPPEQLFAQFDGGGNGVHGDRRTGPDRHQLRHEGEGVEAPQPQAAHGVDAPGGRRDREVDPCATATLGMRHRHGRRRTGARPRSGSPRELRETRVQQCCGSSSHSGTALVAAESKVTRRVARLPTSASIEDSAAVTCQRPRARAARCALCTRPAATSVSSARESSTSSSAPRSRPATALSGAMPSATTPRVVSVVRRRAIRFVSYPAATAARFGARTGTGTRARSSATSAGDE